MARPLQIEYAGAVYHVTTRGNGRQDIYLDDGDRSEFLEILSRTIVRNQWLCHAYSLMTNHYHLVIETCNPTLLRGMRYLNGVYSQYLNRKHKRVGHVFQGRYKGILVEKDSYLLELSRYVVLNPVRARMVRSAKDWSWSSYWATAGMVALPSWLTVDWVLGGFGRNRKKAIDFYRQFVSEGNNQPSIWEELKNQIYLGTEQFVEDMQCKLNPEQSLENVPKPQKGLAKKPLSYYEKKGASRNAIMALAYRSGCYTLKEIGLYFGVSHATVGRVVQAYECEM